MTERVPFKAYLAAVAAMALVVVASNVLVRHPVEAELGPLNLADLLTYGAFTYPVAFLVTDVTNRRFGLAAAQRVVLAGFMIAVVLSAFLSTPRIAAASATAFLVGQMVDASVFDLLRRSRHWWRAPLVGSLIGSALDTAIFFSLAFAAAVPLLGASDDFAVAAAPLLGLLPIETPRWASWALADFTVKTLFALLLLGPYRGLVRLLVPQAA